MWQAIREIVGDFVQSGRPGLGLAALLLCLAFAIGVPAVVASGTAAKIAHGAEPMASAVMHKIRGR